MEKLIGFTIGLGILVLAAQSVAAQSARNCGPRPAVMKQLTKKYGETRQSIGLAGSAQIVEVFASQETGTWTITVTSSSGIMCIAASGQAYETVTETHPTQDDDA